MIFTIGFWTTVRPHQRRRTLVIGDRWLYGYVAQPWALRYYGPHWLARAAISAVPRPDLVASLTAPPDIVRVRKPELSHEEIQQELDAWADLPRAPLLSFSTEMDPSSVAAAILASIGASPAASPPSDSLS